jgi:predicted amidohydrolase
VKVAAYQAPLVEPGSNGTVTLVRAAVKSCETKGVEILCCPEAILGGLADYAADPRAHALDTSSDALPRALAPLASDSVATIVGFSEIAAGDILYNAAAVLHRGKVVGVYRKRHPAINRSVYAAGHDTPVFTIGNLMFGILICNDSNHHDAAALMADRGAAALFIPTNNGLPSDKTGPGLVAEARRVDAALARDYGVWVIRADVAGGAAGLVSDGSSEIVSPAGLCVASGCYRTEDLLIAEIDTNC